MKNLYLEEYKKRRSGFLSLFDLRTELTRKYAWAIPNNEAINCLAKASPLIEIGAGSGYWASLIKQVGGDIICFDIKPDPESNDYTDKFWFDVRLGDESLLSQYPDRTLFLCWPPYCSSMPFNALQVYQGDRLFWGGCNAEDEFFEILDREWELVQVIEIPQWYGINDYFHEYKRI